MRAQLQQYNVKNDISTTNRPLPIPMVNNNNIPPDPTIPTVNYMSEEYIHDEDTPNHYEDEVQSYNDQEDPLQPIINTMRHDISHDHTLIDSTNEGSTEDIPHITNDDTFYKSIS